MAEDIRVVAHFRDGSLLRGSAIDFMLDRPSFHLRPHDGTPPVEVRCADLKALFFVKSLRGNPRQRGLKGFLASPGSSSHGIKVVVRFEDGEILCGYSHTVSKERLGFFVFPADPNSNNIRVYVITDAAVEVKTGAAADLFARSILQKRIA